MPDLSASFNPGDIATASDAASSALVAVSGVSDAASNAGSMATVALSKASDASSAVVKLQRTVILKIYNEASAISEGSGVMYFTVPPILNGMNLISCGGHLYTAATSDVVEVQINNVTSGVDMLSSKLTWDATEKDTATANSAAVIDTGNDGVATGEELRIDIDSAASGAKGMEIRLTFQTP